MFKRQKITRAKEAAANIRDTVQVEGVLEGGVRYGAASGKIEAEVSQVPQRLRTFCLLLKDR